MKKNNLTFIVPTKNRPVYLKRLLNDCKKKLNYINPSYIIIDASDDINFYTNKKIVQKLKKAKIVRQKSKGIQMSCIEAMKYLKTTYVSFLYDDDVLGKYVKDIYLSNMIDKNIFSFGTGIIDDINKNTKFEKISYLEVPKYAMLSAYYGENVNKILKTKGANINTILPVSPICTCFKTQFLKKWKKILFNFTKNNQFRNYFFFKKDVGPDMLVYLMNIYQSQNKVKFFTPYSVKFSSHDKSISIIYGNNFLRIGYWLARICFFKNFNQKNKEFRVLSYNYLIVIGLILIFSNIFNSYYLKNVLKEFFKLLKINEKISLKVIINYFYHKVIL